MGDITEALYERTPPPQPPKPSRIADALQGGSQWLVDNIGQFVPPELRGKVGSIGQMLNMVNPATAYQNYNEAARQGNYGDAALNTLGLIPGEALATGAAKLGAGALSSAAVIGMRDWKVGRELNAIKQRNLRETFSENGGGIIQELPNKWSIGYRPGADADVSHVLLSPQGGPALYGRSPTDIVKRGFPDDEIPDLLNALRAK